MSATSRELVLQTLNRENPRRAPRELWWLPIAQHTYPQELAALRRDFPDDCCNIGEYNQGMTGTTRGDPYELGQAADAWGCTFVNIQRGLYGQMKDPLVKDWQTDLEKIHVPREWLTIDRDAINRDCAASDCFTAGGPQPRPFEQLEFLRGMENLLIDLLDPAPQMLDFLRVMHAFYCEVLTAWAKTDVDSLRFMDDWGSQRALLIAPSLWREVFKPLYRDYAQIAHAHGKRIFMPFRWIHSAHHSRFD